MQYAAPLLALGALAAAQTPPYPPAPVAFGNPPGASYKATLPDKASTTIRGSVSAMVPASGGAVAFTVSLTGMPAAVGGDFIYHIHEAPVPADGNCTSTLAHLDPTKRGEDPVCDAAFPATCQVGDLAGKYGKIPGGGAFAAAYADPYVSAVMGSPSYFGDKSIVIHYANKTRITCANFVMMEMASNGTGSPMPSGTGSMGGGGAASPTYSMPMPSSSIVTGAGAVAGASVGAGLLALAAMLL